MQPSQQLLTTIEAFPCQGKIVNFNPIYMSRQYFPCQGTLAPVNGALIFAKHSNSVKRH